MSAIRIHTAEAIDCMSSDSIGARIRRRRLDIGITLSELARQAAVSKAYLSQIETGQARHPSAEVLYRIAVALGVTIAHLLGEPFGAHLVAWVSSSLRNFANQAGLSEEDVMMLATARYQGRQPQTVNDWWFLWQAIQRSVLNADV